MHTQEKSGREGGEVMTELAAGSADLPVLRAALAALIHGRDVSLFALTFLHCIILYEQLACTSKRRSSCKLTLKLMWLPLRPFQPSIEEASRRRSTFVPS